MATAHAARHTQGKPTVADLTKTRQGVLETPTPITKGGTKPVGTILTQNTTPIGDLSRAKPGSESGRK